MNPVFIFGTSGFARETGDIAQAIGRKCTFIARDSAERDSCGLTNVILESDLSSHTDQDYAIGIGDNEARRRVANRFSSQLRFINLIHPTASFGAGQLEAIKGCSGLLICAGVRLTNNITIGNFTILNLNVTVGHDVVIDSFVNIAPGANISGNVHVCDGVWIGTNATLNQGTDAHKLEVGNNTMIGSGSVVVKDCDPDSVYVGIPAKRR